MTTAEEDVELGTSDTVIPAGSASHQTPSRSYRLKPMPCFYFEVGWVLNALSLNSELVLVDGLQWWINALREAGWGLEVEGEMSSQSLTTIPKEEALLVLRLQERWCTSQESCTAKSIKRSLLTILTLGGRGLGNAFSRLDLFCW